MYKDFPWNLLPQGTTVCDVGGGVGGVCIKLAKRYPKLHFVLQDLPKPLVIAEKEIWPEYCPEAISENRVEFIPLDFFKGPPKEGCAIYYVRFMNSSPTRGLYLF
jgi:tRNA1(Val) A37 N6-methylase TrmN6